MRKKLLIAAATAAALAFGSPQASATPVIAIDLDIDGSGSIAAADFLLQQNAYAAVLATLPVNSTIAIGVQQFGSVVASVFPVTIITSAADRTNLINAINAMVQDAGSTALGPAIQSSQARLLALEAANPGDDILKIDVSTDGVGNTGIDQITAANNAIAAGIDQVNCLGIGAGANCNFEAGAGAFQILVGNFADFQTALAQKISQETGQVPEPATLLLLGAGLLGLGLWARKVSQA